MTDSLRHLSLPEERFLQQSEPFLQSLLHTYSYTSLSDVRSVSCRPPVPIDPVLVNDYRHLTPDERGEIVRQFRSEHAVAYFIVLNHPEGHGNRHPMLDLAGQLDDKLEFRYPMTQDLETHPDVLARFGGSDGTTKIYRRPDHGGALGGGDFALHQDGLGNGGHVVAGGLYMDSAPLYGGYTYFQNVARLALDLARLDWPAFQALFLPDALTVFRSTGSRAIKITGPMLYLNPAGQPCTFLRVADAEYVVSWREGIEPLRRAREYFEPFFKPLAYGSCFVHLAAPGHGCFWNNRLLGHGRTAYSERGTGAEDRVLSRKWWVSGKSHQVYEHYPGLAIQPEYASLFPEYFGSEVLQGEWVFDSATGRNVRRK